MSKQFKVPAEVATAIATGRTQFLDVVDPQPMDAAAVREMYGLIGQFIEQQTKDQRRIRTLEGALRDVLKRLNAMDRTLNEMDADLDALISSQEGGA
jgi:hypothetical protein